VYVYSDDIVARKIIGRLEDADLMIAYVGASYGTGLSRSLFGGITRDFNQVSELAFVPLGETANGDVRPRILWSTRKVQALSSGFTMSRQPTTNATRSE
jgi:hypothetical protein